MKELITIDELTKNSVSVKREKVIQVEGIEYRVPNPTRKSYVNSINGRIELEKELNEPFINSVLTVWGNEPTIEETINNIE